ncbi:MAG: hypothetical protein H3Z50_00425 [archaeon]|nr:hypothetical protein [archaeon]
MARLLRKMYSMIVNLNQWFTYGKAWLLLPITILSSLGSISIIIIYLGIEQSLELLILLGTIFIVTNVGVGVLLFKKKGQQVDIIMQGWRNPLPSASNVSIQLGMARFLKKSGVPFPKELESWGMKDWDDVIKVCRYILKKGEDAYAKPICQQFFEVKGETS